MNPNNLKERIADITKLDLAQAQIAFSKLLKDCSEDFSPNNIRIDYTTLVESLKILQNEFQRLTSLLIEYQEYSKSCFLFRQFERIMMYADIRQIISLNSWLEYNYDLCMMLQMVNYDLEALHRIDSLIGRYLLQPNDFIMRINSEEDDQPKSISELSFFYSYMIMHCKLANIISAKSGDRKRVGKFQYYEMLLTEKLYFTKDELNYDFQFATLKRKYIFSNEIGHSTFNPKILSKGWQLMKLNAKYLAFGLLYKFFRLTTGYGEKPQRLLLLSLFLVLSFSALYSYLITGSNWTPFNFWFESYNIFNIWASRKHFRP